MKTFLDTAQWWDKNKIDQWQLNKLKEVIKYSYKNVPGYYFLFKEHAVEPDSINSLQDIKLIPFITKEIIRDNLKDFTSRAVSRFNRKYLTTGGSTGIPLGFYNTWKNYFIEHAFMFHDWEQNGWNLGDKTIVLRGALIGDDLKFWSDSRFTNDLLISTYFLNEKNYKKYKDLIQKSNIKFLQAYPSSLTVLADLIIANNDVGFYDFKTIFLGSENLYDWQLSKFRTVFPNTRFHSWYGHAEKVIYAPNCSNSGQYHLNPFYGLTEILDSNNLEVDGGQTGELVGTSFWNLATPFIRYRTMDYATRSTLADCPCKRNYQSLERIEGRLQEFIITSTGRYISMTMINMHDDIFDQLQQFQFLQEKEGEVCFKYVIKKNVVFTQTDSEDIANRLKLKLGDDIVLTLKSIDSIDTTRSGKFRFLEQKLLLKYGE